MRFRTVLALFATALAFCATGTAWSADKASKQAEVRKATAAALEKFYKAEPKLKSEVAKAPGYAVFTSFGMSFLIGGSGGSGIAHDKATKKDTFMSMAQASAGVQAGIAQNDVLLVFKTEKALKDFVDKGWEVGAGATVSGGAGGKSAGGGGGEEFVNDAIYYTLTKRGLEIGGAVAGTKFWKDKDLN
ncbi:MAG TPA: YSC84-related protein [Usitatibacter sp.]|nr:YSC84-related protein [Usitatibacter sp.]